MKLFDGGHDRREGWLVTLIQSDDPVSPIHTNNTPDDNDLRKRKSPLV